MGNLRYLLVGTVLLWTCQTEAEPLSGGWTDPTGEFANTEAEMDVRLFSYLFDNITGDSRIVVVVSNARPLPPDFAVNFNIYNPDTPYRQESFTQVNTSESAWAVPTVWVRDQRQAELRRWRLGQRMTTNDSPAGNPPGTTNFRSSIRNLPLESPPPGWGPTPDWPDRFAEDSLAFDFSNCAPNCDGVTTIQAPPSPIVVNTTADELNNDGDCSLREAIQSAITVSLVDACTGTVSTDWRPQIYLPAGTYDLSLPPAAGQVNEDGDLDLQVDITIYGDGPEATIIDANGIDRAMQIQAGARVGLGDLTVRGGSTSEAGGGILVNGDSSLLINRVIIEGNQTSGDGGGLRVDGEFEMVDSIIRNNSSTGWGAGVEVLFGGSATIRRSAIIDNVSASNGGGIAMFSDSEIQLVNSTVSGNSAQSVGGGIYINQGGGSASLSARYVTIANNQSLGGGAGGLGVDSGIANLAASIVAANRNTNGDQDCSGAVELGGYNVIGTTTGCTLNNPSPNDSLDTDPYLMPLADNGGVAPSHALAQTSPVRAKVPFFAGQFSEGCAVDEIYDQRDVRRVSDCSPGATDAIVNLTELRALYRFDEGNGTFIGDSSGRDFHGTSSGATWVIDDSPVRPTALSFDGSDDEIAIPYPITNMADGDFSLTAWVKIPTGGGGSVLLKGDDDTAWEPGEKTWWFGDNTLCCDANGRQPGFVGFSNDYIKSADAIAEDDWTHIAIVWDYDSGEDGVGTIYIDGEVANLDPDNYRAIALDNEGDTIWIGRDSSAEAASNFLGLLDDVGIWAGALSQQEVQAIIDDDYQYFTDLLVPLFEDRFEGN